MSDLPARIAVWPDFVGHPSMTGQWSANTHPDNAVAYVRADLSDALLREAVEVLLVAADELDWAGREIDEMLCVLSREPRGITGAVADQARATLAKLRAHLGETE